MSSLNTITGRNGRFFVAGASVARTTKWDLALKMAGGTQWGDSDSAGFTNRAAGRKDATFNAEGKYDSTSEAYDLFQPEDFAAVKLYLVASGAFYNFPRALCDSFNLAVNIDTEEVIGWTSSWGSDGTFTKPA